MARKEIKERAYKISGVVTAPWTKTIYARNYRVAETKAEALKTKDVLKHLRKSEVYGIYVKSIKEAGKI